MSPPITAIPLPPTTCPCANVKRTCRLVMSETQHVTIHMDRVTDFVDSIPTTTNITWDEEGWHYTASEYPPSAGQERKERIALYILALDAINFCFWPNEDHDDMKRSNPLEYNHLAVALTKLASSSSSEEYFFSPLHLSNITVQEMKLAIESHLLPGMTLPNIAERCRLWNELGHVLLAPPFCTTMNGTCNNVLNTMLNLSQNDGPRLVKLLVSYIPGFRDETIWNGKWVALYKRAQITVGDLNAALNLNLSNMDHLTTFADYRIPQLLRHVGILEYSTALSTKVDTFDETLTREEEVSIRAATVVVVDELAALLHTRTAKKITAVELDWHLWQVGEALHEKGQLSPHHRVKTIFY